MKIDPSRPAQTAVEPESSTASRARQPGIGADLAPADGGVELKRSPTLHDIEQALAAQEVNQARVEAIKAALARGEYRIDPERIASGLIHSTVQTLVEGE